MSLEAWEKIELALSADPRLLSVPRLEDYFGTWAMEEGVFVRCVEHFRETNMAAHVAAASGSVIDRGSYAVADGVALISLRGTLMKSVGSMTEGTSTVFARRAIRQAVADDLVHAVLLVWDSPGGTVAGTQALAADIAAAGKQKPVDSYIEDLCASAAYWGASQSRRISAGPTALVGSIGTYMAVVDWSARAAMEGAKVHIIKAGAFKSAGTAGTPITGEQLAEWQRNVDALNSHFLAGVAAGRRMALPTVQGLADGRVHIADEALKLGLIDAVESRDAALARLVQRSQPPTKSKGKPMSATLAEIKAACPGASAEFILAQLDKGADVAQAAAAFITHQAAQLEQVKAKAAADLAAKQAELDQAAAKAKMPGVDPVPAGKGGPKAGADGDAVTAWNDAIADKVKAGRTKAQAAAEVNREKPELREAYVAAYNAAHRSKAG